MELTDLSDEPVKGLKLWPDAERVRRLIYLGSFVMLAMVTQFMVNAADNMMVGRLEAAEATASQAALGLGMPLYWAVGGFFSAVSYGTQALVGRRYAEGDDHKTGQVLFNSFLVAVVAGTMGTLIGWFGSPIAVDFLAEASAEQKALGTSYSQLRALGIIGTVITFSFKAFFDGIGRTYVHLIAALVMNFLNIGLNYLLIYGSPSLGIPKMGLDGAGIASSISTFVGMGIMFVMVMRPRYGRRFRVFRLRNLDTSVMRTIIKLMLPSGSASVILMSGFLLFMMFVGQIDAAAGGGNTYSAATKAAMDTAAFCFMPLLAFGTATATAVSQSLGAKKPNLAANYGWDAVRVCVWAMVVVGVVMWIWPEEIIRVWSPNDPAVPAAGAVALRMIAVSLPAMTMGLILSQALYGAGANTYVMVAEGLLHIFVLVPLSYLLGPYLGGGMVGIWTAAITYVFGLGIAMGAKFLSKGWRTIKL